MSVVSVVSEEKQRSERSQIFHFNSSEVKQRSEGVASEEKRRSELSQIFHFNSGESKTA